MCHPSRRRGNLALPCFAVLCRRYELCLDVRKSTGSPTINVPKNKQKTHQIKPNAILLRECGNFLSRSMVVPQHVEGVSYTDYPKLPRASKTVLGAEGLSRELLVFALLDAVNRALCTHCYIRKEIASCIYARCKSPLRHVTAGPAYHLLAPYVVRRRRGVDASHVGNSPVPAPNTT